MSSWSGPLTLLLSSALLLLLTSSSHSAAALKAPHLLGRHRVTRSLPQQRPVSYTTLYLDQQIDHFGFLENGTFKQRYLLNDLHWHKDNSPILFYTGNEGDITWFCNNTGFMWDIAEELGAMLVFAEHRYYGESLPFGDESYSNAKYLNYLTSEQALADFAVLIENLKKTYRGAQNSPVIAIGGSYGGMLSAWLRMKYPSAVVGALAASAPIWQFTDMVPCGDFYKIVTQDFAISGFNCSKNIRRSWMAINNVSSTDEGLQWLSEEFRLCSPLKEEDVSGFKGWLQETWVNLAMVDYPYEANFLQPLPRWPIKVVCSYLSFVTDVPDKELLHGISQAVNVYYNYTGNAECLNISLTATGNLGIRGWFYQSCTEMVMPMCTDGIQDMFEPQPWNFQAFSDECYDLFGVRPREHWAGTVYGGKNIGSHSNIIFSNGRLDPWMSGGVTRLCGVSDSLVAIVIPDGAHHLDLRYNNEYDPETVIRARSICDRASFNTISKLLQSIKATKDYAGLQNVPIVIVGNKRDLHHRRTVLSEEGRLLALSADCQFYEVSAAENYHSVLMVFHGLVNRVRESRSAGKKPAGIKGIVKSMSAVFARRRTDSL